MRIDPAVLHEPLTEVGRDDAHSPLGREPVDSPSRQDAIERIDVWRVGRREPVLDVGRARDVIGHARIDLEQVQALEGEVPDVLDDVAAHIAPEESGFLLVAFI